jgi:ABC-type phosphate transport system ATPase subunit
MSKEPEHEDIPPEYRARIEAEYRAAMTLGELALVDEFDELERERSAGELTSGQRQRLSVVAAMQDRIWTAALARKFLNA